MSKLRSKGLSALLEIETIYGSLNVPDWNDDLIVRSLIDLGEWSYVEQCLASQLVRKNDVIWDGGAFLGTFGIGVAQLAKAGGRPPSRLLAIEPNKELGGCVTANLERAMPSISTLAPFAVGPASSRLTVAKNQQADRNHGALAYAPVTGEEGDEAWIESRALWQLRQQFGDYDFLKLDVEGMELEAIKSDFEYIRQRKPVIWAECNESSKSILVHEAMIALGYDPVYLAFPAFRQSNFHNRSDLRFSMAYEAALLAAPKDRLEQFPVALLSEDIIRREVATSWDLRQSLWATPRWAEPDWVSMNKAELIALLGRMTRGESLGTFLNS